MSYRLTVEEIRTMKQMKQDNPSLRPEYANLFAYAYHAVMEQASIPGMATLAEDIMAQARRDDYDLLPLKDERFLMLEWYDDILQDYLMNEYDALAENPI